MCAAHVGGGLLLVYKNEIYAIGCVSRKSDYGIDVLISGIAL